MLSARLLYPLPTDSIFTGGHRCPLTSMRWRSSPSRGECFAREPIDGLKYWCLTRDGDPVAFRLARRHYSAWKNKSPKIAQFMGPGYSIVLISPWEDALFGWRVSIRDDGQEGVCCTIFRNEGLNRSSDMIREAELIAWQRWPGQRLFTHVDPSRVLSKNPGFCFFKAGWVKTKTVTTRGLIVWEKLR